MKKEILHLISKPATLFWVPMKLGVANICLWLAVLFVTLPILKINPLTIVIALVVCHFLLFCVGKKEPHINKIMQQAAYKNPLISCDKYDFDSATVLFKDKTFACVFELKESLPYDKYTQFWKELAESSLTLRFVKANDHKYLVIASTPKSRVEPKSVIQGALSMLPCELLTNSSETTPADLFKLILNPSHDDLYVSSASLYDKGLLTNQRMQIKKDIMSFEQNKNKVYSNVLSLTKVDESADFSFLNDIHDYPVIQFMKPLSYIKVCMMIGQLRRMSRLTNPSPAVDMQCRQALAQIEQNEDVFFMYGANIYVTADSLEQLKAQTDRIIAEGKQNGLHFVKETYHLPATYYMILPQYEMPRQLLLRASDFSDAC